jgi:hypothetical protein
MFRRHVFDFLVVIPHYGRTTYETTKYVLFSFHYVTPTFNVPRVAFAGNLAGVGDILVLFEE